MSFKPSWLQPGRYPRLLIEHTNGKTSNIPLNDDVQWERRDTELVVFFPHYVQHFPLVTIEHYAIVDAVDYPQRTQDEFTLVPDEFTLAVIASTDHTLDRARLIEDFHEHKANGGTAAEKCILSTSCLYCQRVARAKSKTRPTTDVSFQTDAFRRIKSNIRPGHDCSDPTCPFV